MTDVGVPQRRSLRRLREDGGEDSDRNWWGLVEGEGGGGRGGKNADFTTKFGKRRVRPDGPGAPDTLFQH